MIPIARRGLPSAALVVASLVAPGCDGPAPGTPAATPAAAPAISGHDRMVALLRSIADRTDEDNHFLGDARTRKLRKELADLPADATAMLRLQTNVAAAVEEARIGNEQAAIERLAAAKALLPALGPGADPDTAADLALRLGMAYLRFGESENCCKRPNAESCILPIRGGGLHTAPLGSEHAVEQFREALRLSKPNSIYALKAKWLLNIAAMTLGQWPDGLAAEERIPQSAFDSGVVIPRFENVAQELGVDTFHLAGGVVVDDLDGDGVLDILTSTSDTRGPMRFLHGDGKGGFEDRTKAAGLDVQLGGLNMVGADYDNDGDVDVLVLRGGWWGAAGRHPQSLLRNDGTGRFTDVTFDAGLGEVVFPSQTGAWGDYDGDGDVDLYVGSETSPENPVVNQLFRNNGDGTFTDVAREAGVESNRFAKAVVWGDYDGDNRPDLYVSNQGSENRLYRNNGDGTFADVAPQLGVTGPVDSFPAFFFDYDNDGALDLYVSSYRGRSPEMARVAASAMGIRLVGVEMPRLYRGDGEGSFRDVAAEVGVDRIVGPMAANFGDLNLDGWLDFYMGTGYPDYDALMPNVMYLNLEGRRFANVSWSGGFGHLQKGHGIAFADLDHDGDMDVFEQMGGALRGDGAYDALYRNPGFGGHWLTVQCVGRRSNRSAIGARIRADIVEGDRRRSVFRHVNSGGSFGCNPFRQMLGLGQATRVARLEVLWPATGLVQVFEDVPADRGIRIVEGADAYEPLDR